MLSLNALILFPCALTTVFKNWPKTVSVLDKGDDLGSDIFITPSVPLGQVNHLVTFNDSIILSKVFG